MTVLKSYKNLIIGMLVACLFLLYMASNSNDSYVATFKEEQKTVNETISNNQRQQEDKTKALEQSMNELKGQVDSLNKQIDNDRQVITTMQEFLKEKLSFKGDF
jgi:peptidoglycan hydrolase CwlO-like protein